MKKLTLLIFTLFLFYGFKGYGQTESLVYNAELSQKRKGTKTKQLEGLQGDVKQLVLKNQKNHQIEIDITLDGYEDKHLKVFALSKSGSRKLEIPPYFKKVRSGTTNIRARLNFSGSKATDSDFIEVVFTNGGLRFKGISHVFEFKKHWTSKETAVKPSPNDPTTRPSQIIALHLKPIGEAKRRFSQNNR
ncbi:hypothetical protein [Spongiimicrobium salis]|uniref:hypothetical protein n=1 Tax=Spongiimicrobium salis TaxID=1667022 RepID=UPI00374CDB90